LVTSTKKRKAPLLTKQDLEKQQRENEVKKPKKKEIVLDFYQHQARENKREQLADLRRKFEEDKKKIEKMKETRKFNPF
jgi:ribosomal RNA-processing protein 7